MLIPVFKLQYNCNVSLGEVLAAGNSFWAPRHNVVPCRAALPPALPPQRDHALSLRAHVPFALGS